MVQDAMYCLRCLIVFTINLKAIFFSEFGCLIITPNVVFIQENHEWRKQLGNILSDWTIHFV
jgi:hypothetical protein